IRGSSVTTAVPADDNGAPTVLRGSLPAPPPPAPPPVAYYGCPDGYVVDQSGGCVASGGAYPPGDGWDWAYLVGTQHPRRRGRHPAAGLANQGGHRGGATRH